MVNISRNFVIANFSFAFLLFLLRLRGRFSTDIRLLICRLTMCNMLITACCVTLKQISVNCSKLTDGGATSKFFVKSFSLISQY